MNPVAGAGFREINSGVTSSKVDVFGVGTIIVKGPQLGPGGEAPPAGRYARLVEPVVIDGKKYTELLLVGGDALQTGRTYNLVGKASVVSERRVTTTVRYAILEQPGSVEVEPPEATMQRAR